MANSAAQVLLFFLHLSVKGIVYSFHKIKKDCYFKFFPILWGNGFLMEIDSINITPVPCGVIVVLDFQKLYDFLNFRYMLP